MVWKADEINPLPGGWREEIKHRRTLGCDGAVSRMVKIVDAEGHTIEMWHEVFDAQGRLIHRHEKPVSKEGAG